MQKIGINQNDKEKKGFNQKTQKKMNVWLKHKDYF